MNAGLSVELQLCYVRLVTVSLLCLCAYAVTAEVDIQSAVDPTLFFIPPAFTVFTIQQSPHQVLYVYHLIPPFLTTLPDICLRSQNKPEFKFRSDSYFRDFHLCLRYLSIAVIRHHDTEFIGGLLTVLEG